MFSMGSKLKLGSSISMSLLTPEPGRYTPKYQVLATKKSAPAFKIGNGNRSISYNKTMADLVPAPNKYVIKSPIFDQPPKFYIGQLTKFDDFKQNK